MLQSAHHYPGNDALLLRKSSNPVRSEVARVRELMPLLAWYKKIRRPFIRCCFKVCFFTVCTVQKYVSPLIHENVPRLMEKCKPRMVVTTVAQTQLYQRLTWA